jgi:hypothetical protein
MLLVLPDLSISLPDMSARLVVVSSAVRLWLLAPPDPPWLCFVLWDSTLALTRPLMSTGIFSRAPGCPWRSFYWSSKLWDLTTLELWSDSSQTLPEIWIHFGDIGSTTPPLTASEASESIEIQHKMVKLLSTSSNKYTARAWKISHLSFHFAAHPGRHNMSNIHDVNDTQAVSFTNKMYKTESVRFSSMSKTSATIGF